MTPEHFVRWCETLLSHPDLELYRDLIPIFVLTVTCALRIDEAQGLRRCDIVLENGRARKVKIEPYPGHRLKSPNAGRTLTLTEEAISIVEARLATAGAPTDPLWPKGLREYHRAQRGFEKACILAGLHDAGEQFLTDLEKMLNKRVAAKELTVFGRSAELQRAKAKVPRCKLKALYTMHSLRHTLATRLDEDGMPLNEIRLLLGQASISTTQRYIRKKLSKEIAEDAAARSSRVLPFATLLGRESSKTPAPFGATLAPAKDARAGGTNDC